MADTKKMTFKYFTGEQRTPEWYALRLGKVTASRLEAWLSVSKAKNTLGKPLKARLDYETELLFERQFGKSFDNFVTDAMQDGIDFENFARRQYEVLKGVKVEEVGAWYNEYFVASPDGAVGEDGLAEIKVVRDNTFTQVLTGGVPQKWWKQIQGQLWASGRKWCDFICINLNTRKVKIIRVLPDAEFHEWLELAIAEPITTNIEVFDMDELYNFVDVPEFDMETVDRQQGGANPQIAPELQW